MSMYSMYKRNEELSLVDLLAVDDDDDSSRGSSSQHITPPVQQHTSGSCCLHLRFNAAFHSLLKLELVEVNSKGTEAPAVAVLSVICKSFGK